MSFVHSFSADFVWDDIPQIVSNDKIHSLQYIPDYFSKGVWENSSVEMKDKFLYRPFFLLFLALNYAVWGNNPLGFHLMNILLHAVNSIIVFFIIKEISPKRDVNYPLWGSLLFALHPLHVESVSFISGSTDLLLTFFFAAAFLSYLHYEKELRFRFFLITVIFFVGALLSKEPAAVFPVIVVAWDLSRSGKLYVKRVVVLFAITAIYLLVRGVALGRLMGGLHVSAGGFVKLAEFAGMYIKLLVVPWPLSIYLKAPSIRGVDAVFSVIFLLGLLWIALRDRRSLFFLLWLFLTLAPSLSTAFFDRPTFAERFAYLPSLGFVVVLVLALQSFKVPRKILLAGLSTVISVYAVLCFLSTRDWKSDETVYAKAIKTTPDAVGGYQGLANYYENKSQYEKAVAYQLDSLKFASDDEMRASIYDNLGRLYGVIGDSGESVKYYEKEIAIIPGSSTAYVGIGNNYFMRREYGTALGYYRRAYEIDKKNYEACYDLAMLHEILGNKKDAQYFYLIFLRNAPAEKYARVKAAIRKRYPELLGR